MQLQVLFVVFATLASSMRVPIKPLHLFQRQATCPANFEQCGSSLPSIFCCPKGKVCLQLAGKTSTLCCDSPDGCQIIAPILCDVQLQRDPRSSVKTTALNSDLPKCGKDCCPFGYSCNDDSECVKDSDQNKVPPSRALSTIALPSPTPTVPSAPASTSSADTATARPATSGTPSSQDDSAAKISIIGGVVGGLILLIVIGLGLCFCFRRKKTEETLPASGRSTSVGVYPHAISHPIMSENSAMRSDFNRKDGSNQFRTVDLKDDRRPVSYNSERNPFSDRPVSSGTTRSAVAPLRGMRTSNGSSIGSGRFPPRQGGYGGMGDGRQPHPEHQRHPSTESINVFADPRTVSETDSDCDTRCRSRRSFEQRRMSNQTTFTHMMRQADLTPDQPFVPPTAYNTPDHR